MSIKMDKSGYPEVVVRKAQECAHDGTFDRVHFMETFEAGWLACKRTILGHLKQSKAGFFSRAYKRLLIWEIERVLLKDNLKK